jgi:hypothetical protein
MRTTGNTIAFGATVGILVAPVVVPAILAAGGGVIADAGIGLTVRCAGSAACWAVLMKALESGSSGGAQEVGRRRLYRAVSEAEYTDLQSN